MKFNDRLKSLREEMGLKQIELAKLVNMPKTTYHGYESGRREPDFNILELFANFFNVTTDYLLGYTNVKYESMNIKLNNLNLLSKEELQFIIDFFSQPENKGYLMISKEAKEHGISADILLAFVKGFQFGSDK